jgi:DNA-binding response OmpR family regulator
MEETKVLIVDDEPEITELIGMYLSREGFDVHTTDNGTDALKLAEELQPDLIILDIQLNNADGIEICRQIRETSNVPILFVSCKDDDTDIIHGLSAGGDDYVTKPFSPKQLVARVRAHLRRQSLHVAESLKDSELPAIISFDGLVINADAHTVHLNGKPIPVSAKEFDLLTHLARHPNKAFHLDDLYKIIWGADSVGDTRTLMVHVSNLRKKIEPDPANPEFIITVRGVGYKFNSKEGSHHVYR